MNGVNFVPGDLADRMARLFRFTSWEIAASEKDHDDVTAAMLAARRAGPSSSCPAARPFRPGWRESWCRTTVPQRPCGASPCPVLLVAAAAPRSAPVARASLSAYRV
jgi:hypothetical protein